MKQYLFFFTSFIILAITSCKQSDKKNFNSIQTDTTGDKQLSVAFEDFTSKLQLPSIRNGVDSFEYRFWLSHGDNYDIINLVRIRFVKSKWFISETLIWSHMPDYTFNKYDTVNHLLETIVDSTKTRNIEPAIAINEFIDSLRNFNIEQAPLNAEIFKSFSPHMDGINQTIEIADKNNYRLISYPCPVSITSLKDFHYSMSNLFRFLQRQLPIKFNPC